MNSILSILCTIGAVVAYVIIVFFLTFACAKSLDTDIVDDFDIMMIVCINQFFIAMIIIIAYFLVL